MGITKPFLIFGDKDPYSVLGQFNESIRSELAKTHNCITLDLNTNDVYEMQFLKESSNRGNEIPYQGIIQIGNNRFSGWNLLASRQGNYSLLIHDLYIWDSWHAFICGDPLLQQTDFLKIRILENDAAMRWILNTGWKVSENTVNSLELLVRLMILSNGVITHSKWAEGRLKELQELIPRGFTVNFDVKCIPLPFFNPTYFDESNTTQREQMSVIKNFQGSIFTSLGSHDANRGLIESIDALNRLDTSEIMLVVGGRIDSALRAEAMKKLKTLKVIFLGAITELEYRDLLDLTTIFINLRKTPYEAASGTLVDSIRTGKPTVINNSGCRSDFVDLPNTIVTEHLTPQNLVQAFKCGLENSKANLMESHAQLDVFDDLESYSIDVAQLILQYSSIANLDNYRVNRTALSLGYNF